MRPGAWIRSVSKQKKLYANKMAVGNESEERNQRATALLVKSLSLLALVGSELSVPTQASPPRGYERWAQGPGSAFSMLLKLGAFSCGALVLLTLLLSSCTSQSVFMLQGWLWLTFRFWGSTLHFRAVLGLSLAPFLLSLDNCLAGQGQARPTSCRCHQCNL